MNLLKNQPKALYLLFFVKMWECFSFYGMRALMVLYLIDQMGINDIRAYGIYALYCSLVEFGGILGGRYADKLLGLGKSIVWGGWLIAAGHICLAAHSVPWFFFVGLSLIVVGSGLFSTNISALLGLFYEDADPRRESGFTLFYVGINIGAILASLLCGFVAEIYGWHYGFGLAAIGMIAGNLLLLKFQYLLEGKGKLIAIPKVRQKIIGYLGLIALIPATAVMIAYEDIFLHLMPWGCLLCVVCIGKKMIASGNFSRKLLINLGLYLAALAIFFAAEDQTASALLVFSERFAASTALGIHIPTATLLSLNPFVIILGGALVSKLQTVKPLKLIILGLLLASIAFASLTIVCHFPGQDGLVPLEIVVGAILIISMGEVLLAPAIFSYFSEIAPKGWTGVTMGLIPLGFSTGNAISGFLSKSMVAQDGASVDEALAQYGEGFTYLALLLLLVALFILLSQGLIPKTINQIRKIDEKTTRLSL